MSERYRMTWSVSTASGNAVVQYPDRMSEEDLRDFHAILGAVQRNIERRLARIERARTPEHTGPEFRAISVR